MSAAGPPSSDAGVSNMQRVGQNLVGTVEQAQRRYLTGAHRHRLQLHELRRAVPLLRRLRLLQPLPLHEHLQGKMRAVSQCMGQSVPCEADVADAPHKHRRECNEGTACVKRACDASRAIDRNPSVAACQREAVLEEGSATCQSPGC